MVPIGDKIYQLRKKSGLSQEQLGFEINVSRQTVSKWEMNECSPSTDKIQALCKFFSVSADYFISDCDTKKTEIAATINDGKNIKISNLKPLKLSTIIFGSLTGLLTVFILVLSIIALMPIAGSTETVKAVSFSLSTEFLICFLVYLGVLITFIFLLSFYLVLKSKMSKQVDKM